MSETKRLHFSISGEIITQAARNACHENGHLKEAIEILKSAMICDQLSDREIEQNCYDILNGRSQLCGIYPDGDYHYENIKDKENACDISDTFQSLMSKIKDLEHAIQELQQRYLFVMDNLPSWQLKDLRKEYSAEFDEDFDTVDSDNTSDILSTFSDILRDDTNSSGTGFSPSAATELRDIVVNPESALDNYIQHMMDDDDPDEYGWLEPNGVYHPVEWGEHTQWANDYLHKHYPYAKNKSLYWLDQPNGIRKQIVGGDVLLFKLNWVLIDSPSRSYGKHICNPNKEMTKAQKEFLYNYYIKHNNYKEANKLYK